MKQLTKPLTALVALACLSGMAQADQRPNWNRVGLLYQEQDFIGDSTLDGFGVAGTKRIGTHGLLQGAFSSASTTFDCTSVAGCDTLDVRQEWLTLGVGASQPLAANTDFFAILSYEEQEDTDTVSLKSAQGDTQGKRSVRATGFGARAGVRTMVTELIELTAAVRYLDIEGEDETGYQFGGQYLITEQVSLGLDYSSTSGYKMAGLSVYFRF